MNKYKYLMTGFLCILITTAQAANNLSNSALTANLNSAINNLNSLYGACLNSINGTYAYAISSKNSYKKGILNCVQSAGPLVTSATATLGQLTAGISTVYTATQLSNFTTLINNLIADASQLNSIAQCVSVAANNISLRPSSEAHKGDPRPGAAIFVTQAQSFAAALQQMLNNTTTLYNNTPTNDKDEYQLTQLTREIVINVNKFNTMLSTLIQNGDKLAPALNAFAASNLVSTANAIWQKYGFTSSFTPSGITIGDVNVLQTAFIAYLNNIKANPANNDALANFNTALSEALYNTDCDYCLPGQSQSLTNLNIIAILQVLQDMKAVFLSYQEYYQLS